jgi:hypothetical protein
MNPKILLATVLIFALAAGELLLLRRRLEAQVRAGTITRATADKQRSYQGKLFIGALLICAVAGVGFLVNSR